MKDNIEFVVRNDGTIESIYQDGLEEFAKDMGGEVARVCRASNVEWEQVKDTSAPNGIRSGWTVRAAHDPELALRVIRDGMYMATAASRKGPIITFQTREDAITEELKFFWMLLERKHDIKEQT